MSLLQVLLSTINHQQSTFLSKGCNPDLFISIFDLLSPIFYQLLAPSSVLRADMPLLLMSISQLLEFDRGEPGKYA
jgi:hypothetical protein